jgi:hypothetical protein
MNSSLVSVGGRTGRPASPLVAVRFEEVELGRRGRPHDEDVLVAVEAEGRPVSARIAPGEPVRDLGVADWLEGREVEEPVDAIAADERAGCVHGADRIAPRDCVAPSRMVVPSP